VLTPRRLSCWMGRPRAGLRIRGGDPAGTGNRSAGRTSLVIAERGNYTITTYSVDDETTWPS
jgi:hypothetical protein